MITAIKAVAIALALAAAAAPVAAQEREPRPEPKPELAAHCAGFAKAANDAELSNLPNLRGERARKVLLRHTRATARTSDMQAMMTCLAGAVSAQE